MSSFEQIEKYLSNDLEEQEKKALEEKIKTDPAFAKEVEAQAFFQKSMEAYAERETLKKLFEDFHGELKENTKVEMQVKKGGRFFLKNIKWNFKSISIAATVLLLVTVSSVWLINNLSQSENVGSADYTALRRELEEVREQQKAMSEQNEREYAEESPAPIKQYGATAVAIAPNGYLVTNYHVVKNADSVHITSFSGKYQQLKAELVFLDEKTDLAILKVTEPGFLGFGWLPYAIKSTVSELGEEVFTLAFPRQEVVYGEGSISAQSGYKNDSLSYQISIPVNPGNSGGPLFDEKGNLIGIVSGKHKAMEGAAYAIKALYIHQILDSLKKKNKESPLPLPAYSSLQYQKRTEQIKLLKNYVFLVRVFDGK